jgi:hypothetical protein
MNKESKRKYFIPKLLSQKNKSPRNPEALGNAYLNVKKLNTKTVPGPIPVCAAPVNGAWHLLAIVCSDDIV